MNNGSPFLILDQPCDAAIEGVARQIGCQPRAAISLLTRINDESPSVGETDV